MAAGVLQARQLATDGCADMPSRRDDGELDAAAWPELAAWLTGEDRARLDLQYVRTRSFGLDLKLLLRTVPALLRGRGAY